jgi:putative ubiquitin-RnfH superfamily antitoxin RatB of RatAB toxin-antitoxin module
MPSRSVHRKYIPARQRFQARTVNAAPLQIEVAYAEPGRATVKCYQLDPGASVADALRLAAQDLDFTGVDLANAAIGIFGRLAQPDQALQPGDRIEIYRPLSADPKTARRARAKQAKRAHP